MMISIKDVIPSALRVLQTPEAAVRTQLYASWESVVGPKIAAHTRPSLSHDGHLCVWTDQSTLAFELSQRYRPTILKRTQALLGETGVKTVRIRVGQIS